MKPKHSFFVTVGIPSLFLVFSVLVLSVLSLLTLGSSRSSLSTARHSLEQTEDYYAACRKATDNISGIRSSLEQFASASSGEEAYFSRIQKFADSQKGLTWDASDHTFSFVEKISDTQQLSVVLKLFYPDSENSSLLEILQWSTQLTSTWKPDNSQNVFKGD